MENARRLCAVFLHRVSYQSDARHYLCRALLQLDHVLVLDTAITVRAHPLQVCAALIRRRNPFSLGDVILRESLQLGRS